ncbi:hypothetical protein ACFCVY_05780 [Streptomyces sp. NPDC056411]
MIDRFPSLTVLVGVGVRTVRRGRAVRYRCGGPLFGARTPTAPPA